MAEVVRNADCGLYTPVGDSAWPKPSFNSPGDPARRAVFASNAAAVYDESFTLSQIDSAYMDLYRTPRRS